MSVSLAMAFAANYHDGQVDKQNRDYLTYHLAPVANMARALATGAGLQAQQVETIQAIAWLHDVFEDTAATPDDLDIIGLGHLVPHIQALTFTDHSVTYQEAILRLEKDGSIEEIIVKLADNLVNSTTLDQLDSSTRERLTRKYDEARKVLFNGFIARIR